MITLTKSQLFYLIEKQNISIKNIIRLIAHIKQQEYTAVFFQNIFKFSTEEYKTFQQDILRLESKEPLAKIIQKKEFYLFEFKTNQYTLDPRPETELLIDLLQKFFPNKQEKLEILDLCCGTGCIGLTALKIYPNSTCDLADISPQALQVCKENAQSLNLTTRAKLIESNWLSKINKKYDVIISNPPYISLNFPLEQEVLFDPHVALFAGEDGLEGYRQILPNLKNHLKNKQIAILEIGFNQKEQILQINKNLQFLEIKLNRALVFSGHRS